MPITKLVSLEQASVTALMTYLQTQITDLANVYDRWPEPGVLLENRTITILRVGRRQEILYDPMMLGFTVTSPTTVTSQWQLKEIEYPVQIDIWCTSDIDRDDVAAQLDVALVQGISTTLAGYSGLTTDPYRHGVLVALGSGWAGNADFLFDEKEVFDDDESVQGSEYRATYRGKLWAPFIITTTSPSARMARIWLKRHMLDNGLFTGTTPAAGNYDITEYTDVNGVPARKHPDTQGP